MRKILHAHILLARSAFGTEHNYYLFMGRGKQVEVSHEHGNLWKNWAFLVSYKSSQCATFSDMTLHILGLVISLKTNYHSKYIMGIQL